MNPDRVVVLICYRYVTMVILYTEFPVWIDLIIIIAALVLPLYFSREPLQWHSCNGIASFKGQFKWKHAEIKTEWDYCDMLPSKWVSPSRYVVRSGYGYKQLDVSIWKNLCRNAFPFLPRGFKAVLMFEYGEIQLPVVKDITAILSK